MVRILWQSIGFEAVGFSTRERIDIVAVRDSLSGGRRSTFISIASHLRFDAVYVKIPY